MSQSAVRMFFLVACLSIGLSVGKGDGKMRSEVRVAVNEHGDLVQESNHKATPANAKPEHKAMEINGEGKVVPLEEEEEKPVASEKTRTPVEVSGHQPAGANAEARADQSSLMRSKRTESKITEHDKEEDDPALDELEAMAIRTKLHDKEEHDSVQGSDGHRRRRWMWGSRDPPAKPKVDCRWTPWGDKGDCSKTCGGGKQKQKRKRSPEAANGGRKCVGDDERTKTCNEDDCPTTTTTTQVTMTMSTMAGAISANGVLWLALMLPPALTFVA